MDTQANPATFQDAKELYLSLLRKGDMDNVEAFIRAMTKALRGDDRAAFKAMVDELNGWKEAMISIARQSRRLDSMATMIGEILTHLSPMDVARVMASYLGTLSKTEGQEAMKALYRAGVTVSPEWLERWDQQENAFAPLSKLSRRK